MSGWIETEAGLRREVKTASFMESLDLANRLAPLAEAMSHHPDLELGWGYLRIRLVTHDAGKVTEKDRNLAREFDKILGPPGP